MHAPHYTFRPQNTGGLQATILSGGEKWVLLSGKYGKRKKIVFTNFSGTSSTTAVFLKIWHWEMRGIKYLRLYQQSRKYVTFTRDQNGVI